MNDEWYIWLLPALFFNHAELNYDVIINFLNLKEDSHTNLQMSYFP